MKKKRKRANNKTSLLIPTTKKLDDLLREYLHKKYPNPVCFICKKQRGWFHPKTNPRGCQVGHYVSRRVYSLRWDILNIEPNCSRCNYLHEYNILPFTKAMVDAYGQERIDYLYKKAKEYKTVRFSRKEKISVQETLLKLIKDLEK